jgi:hypothetical protein
VLEHSEVSGQERFASGIIGAAEIKNIPSKSGVFILYKLRVM